MDTADVVRDIVGRLYEFEPHVVVRDANENTIIVEYRWFETKYRITVEEVSD